MPYPIRRRFNVRRSGLKPRNGAVVWTLGRGPGAPMIPLPPVKTHGEVQYVTGGIGESEYVSMRQAQCKFPLALEFVRKAAQHDGHIADVDVSVIDGEGRDMLAVRSDGPYLLAKLPDGEYTVRATYFGHTLEQTVRVAAGASARAVFVWEMKL
jgi:hypothetical protein